MRIHLQLLIVSETALADTSKQMQSTAEAAENDDTGKKPLVLTQQRETWMVL